jgi:hypothetical protein
MSENPETLIEKNRRLLLHSEGQEKEESIEQLMERNRRLVAAAEKARKSEELLEALPQGSGSGLDADMVDGFHARELIAKGQSAGGGGGAGAGGDMEKSVYDTDNDGVVDDSEKLEGSTKAEVQDHLAKAHDLSSDRHPDVNVSSPADGQMLIYDGPSKQWKNLDPDVTVVGDEVGLAKDTSVLSGLTDPPAGKKVMRLESTRNADDTVATVIFKDGEGSTLFTLTFSYSGGNWTSIVRS